MFDQIDEPEHGFGCIDWIQNQSFFFKKFSYNSGYFSRYPSITSSQILIKKNEVILINLKVEAKRFDQIQGYLFNRR